MKIACLHTAESNAPLFDEAAAALGVEVTHVVRADLYRRAIAQGGADEAILSETAAALSELQGDVVLLTCSTIGAAAARVGAHRVDAALAEAAVKDGGVVEAFVTTPTTIETTRALFEGHAAATGATITVTLIDGALDAFLAGDLTEYAAIIAAVANRSGADVVALAQASMAPAAKQMRRRALTSPMAGVMKAVEISKT